MKTISRKVYKHYKPSVRLQKKATTAWSAKTSTRHCFENQKIEIRIMCLLLQNAYIICYITIIILRFNIAELLTQCFLTYSNY